MIYEVMKHIKNYFIKEFTAGAFEISGGTIELKGVQNGVYFLILGSLMNDGVYQYPAHDLKDEKFSGEIAILSPPGAFISLCDEIAEYQKKTSNLGPFQSESFGGYSYSRAMNANGTFQGWQDAYRNRLNEWRKL